MGRKKAWPTAVILDTQSVKNTATATGATVGFDAGKLVKGRKRLVLTDTLGNVLASKVLPANAVDGAAAIVFWDEVAPTHDLLGQVQVIFVDSSFNGVFRQHLAQRYGIRVEKPAHVLVKKTNFCIHAWRWIVERTFAWLNANRRLSKEYDRTLRHANAWITVANIKRVLKFC
jgi:transposase